MYFGMKSYLKSNRNHTAKHNLKKKSINLLLLFESIKSSPAET
jgi:hypothetical protein